MIITKLNGGLGNQMFEYAHARSLQIDNNDEMFLDTEGFEHWNPKYPKRSFSLASFILSDDVSILPIEKSNKLVIWQALSKIDRKLASKISTLFHIYLWKNPNYCNLKFGNTKRGKYYFYGYWQSDRYFAHNSDIIRKELKVKTEILEISKPFIEKANLANSVCVHIRRGDYVTGNMIFCDENYYLSGMRYIMNKHSDANFLIFSDDIDWVKKNIRFEYPVDYVTIDRPDYEVLRIMYSCKHFVISNSSYSWWAQYLSDNEEKIVIAPGRWFPTSGYDNSIYQDNWIIIGDKYE